jgi:broad specificity phosphatase PhoE
MEVGRRSKYFICPIECRSSPWISTPKPNTRSLFNWSASSHAFEAAITKPKNPLDFRPFQQEKDLVYQLNGQIWFVRHAESEANVKRIYANTGYSFPLTERGLKQVKALASQLSALNISAIYASPLLRAVQTAEEICRFKRIEVKIAPELTEYHMGIYEGTSSLPGTAGAISDTANKKRWFEKDDFEARSPGGESLRDMRDRFVPFVTRTMENHIARAGIVLMITHGGILTAMLPFIFENLDVRFVQARPIEHLDIIKGELTGGRLICVEYNGIPVNQ